MSEFKIVRELRDPDSTFYPTFSISKCLTLFYQKDERALTGYLRGRKSKFNPTPPTARNSSKCRYPPLSFFWGGRLLKFLRTSMAETPILGLARCYTDDGLKLSSSEAGTGSPPCCLTRATSHQGTFPVFRHLVTDPVCLLPS